MRSRDHRRLRAFLRRPESRAYQGLPVPFQPREPRPRPREPRFRRASHRRAPSGVSQRRVRSRPRRALFSIWPLPAHQFLAPRRPARESPGPLGLADEPAMERRFSHEHQRADELLALRDREPRRVPDAAFRSHGHALRLRRASGPHAIRRSRLVVHHLTDPWGFAAPADGLQGVWPMGAAWLARQPYEHYLFSGDKQFLAGRAWPLMQGAARFILDYLVEARRAARSRASSSRIPPTRPRTASSSPMAARRSSPTARRWTS